MKAALRSEHMADSLGSHSRVVCFLPGLQERDCGCILSLFRTQLIRSGLSKIVSLLTNSKSTDEGPQLHLQIPCAI